MGGKPTSLSREQASLESWRTERGQFVLRRPSDHDGFIILSRRCIIGIFNPTTSLLPVSVGLSSSTFWVSSSESNKENAVFLFFFIRFNLQSFSRVVMRRLFNFFPLSPRIPKEQREKKFDSWINSSLEMWSLSLSLRCRKERVREEKMHGYRVDGEESVDGKHKTSFRSRRKVGFERTTQLKWYSRWATQYAVVKHRNET